MALVDLKPLDELEVTVVVDNALDILAAARPPASRPSLTWDWSVGDQLRAEHGYSLLVSATSGNHRRRVLYNAGLGSDTVLHNLRLLSHEPKDIETVVLSHGHADQHGSLVGLAANLGKRQMPVILRPIRDHHSGHD